MPSVPTRGVRVVFVLIPVIAAVGFASTDNVVGDIVAVLWVALAIRGTRLGVDFADDLLVVRNVFRTRRTPLSNVGAFGVRWGLANGGPTLYIEDADGARFNVTAFPITRIPGVADRRRRVVNELNEWLAEQKTRHA